jgi:hypothetical protein
MTINLKTKSSRAELPAQGKPHKVSLGRGLTLGYRRTRTGPGSWVLIGSNGNGGQWTETFARADDAEPADGVAVLTYRQATEKAAELASGHGNGSVAISRPVTIDEALTNYAIDLKARGGKVGNASHVRHHLPKALLPELLSGVAMKALDGWRLALLQRGMKPTSYNRLMKSVHAAFNREAKHDPRIRANSDAWKLGLEIIVGADTARLALLTDARIKALVADAYDIDDDFGVYVQAHAELGSRSDQIARITCGDVEADRVMVPNSGKGRNKHKSRSGSTAVPLTANLAKRFAALAKGRPDDAPLIGINGDRGRRLFRRIAGDTTLMAFRHSSIVRALRANVPTKTVADWHNTSVRMIETNYGRFMRNTHDDLIRPALLDTGPVAPARLAA